MSQPTTLIWKRLWHHADGFITGDGAIVAHQSNAVTFAEVQVDVFEGLNHHRVVAVLANRTAS